jgi:hypothetical protein
MQSNNAKAKAKQSDRSINQFKLAINQSINQSINQLSKSSSQSSINPSHCSGPV